MKNLKLTKKSQDQAIKWLRKYKKVIELAYQKWINESDTSNIINDILGDVLWYDKFFEVTTEYKIRGQFCDYGVKLDGKLKFLIEVKAINLELNDNHLFQATSYASNEWVKWVVLTNLRQWKLYRLTFNKKVDFDLVLSVDLLSWKNIPKLVEALKYFHKESFQKDAVEWLFEVANATREENIEKVLFSEAVLKKIRLELKKCTWMLLPIEEIEQKVRDFTD